MFNTGATNVLRLDLPVVVSHMMTRVSQEAVANIAPSGEKAQHSTLL